jgi:hypothetical protein
MAAKKLLPRGTKMNYFDRKRRNVVIGADLLESRTLLNAHLPQ